MDATGVHSITTLLPTFESHLSRSASNIDEDRQQEGVVIFLGTLAKHLDEDEPKVIYI